MVMNFDEHGPISQRLDLLAGIIGSAMDAIIAIDDAGRIVVFNSAAEEIFLCPAREAIGNSIERFIPERFRDEHSTHVRRFADSGVTNRTLQGLGTLWGLRTTGEEFPIEASISKVESGGKKFFAVVVRDITERRRAEQAARESEQRFRLVADTAPVLIWMSGTDKLCTYFNKGWLDFTGRSIEQELGNGWAEGIHPDDLQRCLQAYAQAFDRRENFRMEYRLRRHDGEYRWILDIGVPRFNQDRVCAGYIGVGVDVTERKCAERELAQSNERLNLTLEVGQIGGWAWDLKTGQTFWFGRNYDLLGVQSELEPASDQTFWNRVHPEDRGWLRESVEKALQERRQSAVAEFRVVWPDQTVHWLRSEARYFYGEDGQPERMLGMSVDITERKLAEKTLRESEERFRLAAQAGKMYAYEWDVATDIVARSGDIAHVLGSTGEASLTRRQLLARVHPDDQALFNASVTEPTPEHPDLKIRYRLLSPDGSVVWLEKTAHAFFDEQGRMQRMIGMVADVTERKRAEDALRKSEERLRLATLAGRMYAYEWDVTTDIVVRSPEYVKILGATEPERFSRPQFMNKIHPDDRAKITDAIAGLTPENPIGDVTYRVLLPARAPMWLKNGGRAFFDEKGKLLRVIGMVADVTDHKLAEEALSNVNRSLIQAQEHERARIGRELHDDINQRLAMLAIDIEQMHENPSEVKSRVQELRKELDQISSDVQALSHDLHSSKMEYLGVVAGIRGWCKEFAARQKVEIDFKSEVFSNLPFEVGLNLFRVLQEALQNATKHSGVKLIGVQLSERSDQVHLIIADQGVGFDVETAMKGRGLGLTSMRERVRLVNGTMTIESRPMNGTKIHVCVPFVTQRQISNDKSQRTAGQQMSTNS